MIRVDNINIHVASVDGISELLADVLIPIFRNFRTPIMSKLQEIAAAQAQNRADSIAEKAEVDAKIATLLAGNAALQLGVAALQAQITNGAGVTVAQLDDVLNDVVSEGANIRGIFTPDAVVVTDPADPVV